MNEKIVISSACRKNLMFDDAGFRIDAFLLLTLDDGRQVKVRETDSNIHLSMEPASFYNEKEKGLISQVFDHEDVYLAEPYYSQCCALLSWRMREDSAKPLSPDSFSLSDYGINLGDFEVTLQAFYTEQFKLSRDVAEIVLKRKIF
jgi:hypothetical protein